jgi:glycosyltransferase involved in cell wall biosynthesis
MKFSVVIPAFNEEKQIAYSVGAVKAQNIKRSDFEIIVVDNNSTDKTFAAAQKAGADKVVKETKKGTNLARQRGFEESKGEIVAFLDADCEPPPDWLEKIEVNLSFDGVAAVSGPFDYGFTGLKKIIDIIYTHKIMPKIPYIFRFIFGKKAGVIIGGNFAIRRGVMEKIGGLPQLAFWGDDAATAMLISRKVGKVFFNPALKIKSSPRRLEKSGSIKLTIYYALAYLMAYFNRNYG